MHFKSGPQRIRLEALIQKVDDSASDVSSSWSIGGTIVARFLSDDFGVGRLIFVSVFPRGFPRLAELSRFFAFTQKPIWRCGWTWREYQALAVLHQQPPNPNSLPARQTWSGGNGAFWLMWRKSLLVSWVGHPLCSWAPSRQPFFNTSLKTGQFEFFRVSSRVPAFGRTFSVFRFHPKTYLKMWVNVAGIPSLSSFAPTAPQPKQPTCKTNLKWRKWSFLIDVAEKPSCKLSWAPSVQVGTLSAAFFQNILEDWAVRIFPCFLAGSRRAFYCDAVGHLVDELSWAPFVHLGTL